MSLTSHAAGAGKTKVVSRVIDHIRDELSRRRNDEAFAYFYYSRNDPKCCTPLAAVCSLTRQLSLGVNGRGMHVSLVRLFKSNQSRSLALDKMDNEAAKRLLLEFVDAFAQTTLVLVALDECKEALRMTLVDLLEKLTSGASKPVKIFISSRIDREIAVRLDSGPIVAIKATKNQDDIAMFVEAEIASRPHWRRRLSDELQVEIVRMLCEKSNGMYVST